MVEIMFSSLVGHMTEIFSEKVLNLGQFFEK